MKFYQETTKYDGNYANGIYLLDDRKTLMYAYVSPGTKTPKEFKSPIRIDTRGRTFIEVKNTWNFKISKEVTVNPRWEVKGSKGDVYVVEQTEQGLTCSCTGFKFRGNCKHLSMIP